MPLSKERMRKRKRLDRLGLTLKCATVGNKVVKPKVEDKPSIDADGQPIYEEG